MKATAFNPCGRAWALGFPTQSWAVEGLHSDMVSSIKAVNIIENTDNFSIELALPGFEKEQINVSFDKLLLTISAEKSDTSEENKPNYRRREFKVDSFKRTFEVPKNLIDVQNIVARHENGILYLTLPKLKPAESALTKVSIPVS